MLFVLLVILILASLAGAYFEDKPSVPVRKYEGHFTRAQIARMTRQTVKPVVTTIKFED